ncbi:MAG: DsrE family protein [Thiobacillus sp.]
MLALLRSSLMLCVLLGMSLHAHADKTGPVPFVMQMTVGDSDAQRRALLQIQKVMKDIGSKKVKIEVVAYESGITSLLSNNRDTATLVAALAREGVRFKACRISMGAYELKEDAFPWRLSSCPPERRKW